MEKPYAKIRRYSYIYRLLKNNNKKQLSFYNNNSFSEVFNHMDFTFLSANEISYSKKLGQDDDCYSPLGFSRIPSETMASGMDSMDLEYTNCEIQAESLPYSPTMKVKSPSSPNHSKDSLKFARRITKAFLQFIKEDKDVVVDTFLSCGNSILASQVSMLNVEIIDSKKLMQDSLQLIEDVWNLFTKTLSCSYNKKISKLTKETWNIVFTEEGFWKAAKEAGSMLQVKDYFSGCGEVETEIIRGYFKKILFLVNRGLLIVLLHLKKFGKDDFYENIAKYENYIVLTMVPTLFDAYNHKRGVFVDECCRSCKVCQSKLGDKSIPPKIKTAWEFVIAFEQNFKNHNNIQSFQDPTNTLNILQFLTLLDDAISSFSP